MVDDSWNTVLSRLQTEVLHVVASDPTFTHTQLDADLVPFNALACSLVDRLRAKAGVMQIDEKPWETKLPVLLWLSRSLGLPDHRSTEPDGLLHKLNASGSHHEIVRRVLAEWAVRISDESSRSMSPRHHLGLLLTNEGYTQVSPQLNPPSPEVKIDRPPPPHIIDEAHADRSDKKRKPKDTEEFDSYGNRKGVSPILPEAMRPRKSARENRSDEKRRPKETEEFDAYGNRKDTSPILPEAMRSRMSARVV